jgi:hypothetical protein
MLSTKDEEMISFAQQFQETQPAGIQPVDLARPQTAIVTVTSAALAPLQAIERGLRALAERYRDVAFDLTTPKGLSAAKAARHDLRENGRYLVQRAVQKCKDEANAAKKAVDAEAVRLVSLVGPVETEIDRAITDREMEHRGRARGQAPRRHR